MRHPAFSSRRQNATRIAEGRACRIPRRAYAGRFLLPIKLVKGGPAAQFFVAPYHPRNRHPSSALALKGARNPDGRSEHCRTWFPGCLKRSQRFGLAHRLVKTRTCSAATPKRPARQALTKRRQAFCHPRSTSNLPPPPALACSRRCPSPGSSATSRSCFSGTALKERLAKAHTAPALYSVDEYRR